MFEAQGADRRCFFCLALLIAGVLLVAGAQPQRAAAGSLITGIATVEDDPVAFQHVRDVGARLVLRPISWAIVAPKQEPRQWQPADPADPHYEWSEIDAGVTHAIAAGLSPILQIYGAPQWAQRCHQAGVPAEVPCDPDPAMLAEFAKAAAKRYSGQFGGLPKVRYWQGLNEPNLSLFFNPQFKDGKPVSPVLYRELINAFYFAVKSVDSSNLVLAAGLGPIARPRSTVGPMRFARSLLCMTGRQDPRPTAGKCGGGVYFDIFDIHPYTTGGPTHEGNVDDVQMGDLEKLQELIAAADRAGRIHGRYARTPLWITEFSWDSNPPDPGGVPSRTLTRWAAHAMYRAWSAGVSRFFWLCLRDNAPNPAVSSRESIEAGLYSRGPSIAEDRPKPVLSAFRFPFVAFPNGAGFTFWGRTPTSAGGAVAIEVRERGKWLVDSFARANGNGIFEGTAVTTYGSNGRGFVRARYQQETAVPFSLQEVKDFYQPPFG